MKKTKIILEKGEKLIKELDSLIYFRKDDILWLKPKNYYVTTNTFCLNTNVLSVFVNEC